MTRSLCVAIFFRRRTLAVEKNPRADRAVRGTVHVVLFMPQHSLPAVNRRDDAASRNRQDFVTDGSSRCDAALKNSARRAILLSNAPKISPFFL
jgi:hypothetical protein